MVAVLVGLGGCGIGNSPKFGGNLCELGNAKEPFKTFSCTALPCWTAKWAVWALGQGGVYMIKGGGETFFNRKTMRSQDEKSDD